VCTHAGAGCCKRLRLGAGAATDQVMLSQEAQCGSRLHKAILGFLYVLQAALYFMRTHEVRRQGARPAACLQRVVCSLRLVGERVKKAGCIQVRLRLRHGRSAEPAAKISWSRFFAAKQPTCVAPTRMASR
jgi:hypothetical protein